ncbi:phosphatidylserine decarboxylase [Williamsia maris]|uniref:Phosphatidylserine decarboxylase n=1 Tax=Williamsia maris TaxID=72806 RepID=A0ABT1HDB5_9NOCA|nr:phosphatidylserine decarboxylase [Williamsia maris]MCP2174975.1 phosphatidylserine decarboxylase [Williamsia maris]
MIVSVRRLLVVVAAIVGALFATFAYWRLRFFFRDPERTPPADPRVVVAPADGFITYVKRVDRGQIPFAVKKARTIPLEEFGVAASAAGDGASGFLIGVYMSEYSVHRNRIPVAGTICFREHRSAAPFNRSMARMGANLLARQTPYDEGCDYLLSNERLTIGIEHESGAIATVTQIADLWVNRIVAHVGIGDEVGRGDQYGMIRFGSQCDVFLPDELVSAITVTPGQYVFAGKTPICVSPVSVERGPGVGTVAVAAATGAP